MILPRKQIVKSEAQMFSPSKHYRDETKSNQNMSEVRTSLKQLSFTHSCCMSIGHASNPKLWIYQKNVRDWKSLYYAV